MRLQSDAPGRADACKLSVPRRGIVSEGSGLVLQAAAHNISAGGQGVHGSRSGWCMSAHYVSKDISPGLLRAAPTGEERGAPHYTVSVSPQCPQEIVLPTLPVFQGATVSSEYFSQYFPPGNVAELRASPPSGVSRAPSSAVSCRSSASGHRASSFKHMGGQF